MSNYIKVLPTQSESWARPTEWLAIPAYGVNEEVIYLLQAVWDSTFNPCAFSFNGTGAGYTVDWGDGTTSNHAMNTIAQKNYVYSNLSGSPFRGYRQALIKITPQAGAVIRTVNLSAAHASYPYSSVPSGLLDIICNISTLNADPAIGNSGLFWHNNAERLYVKKAFTLNPATIAYMRNLKYIKIDSVLSGVIHNPFAGTPLGHCKLILNLSNCTVIREFPSYNQNNFFDLSEVIFPNTFNGSNMFSGIYGPVVLPDLTGKIMTGNMDYFYWVQSQNANLSIIPAMNVSAVTSFTNAFTNPGRTIRRSLIIGATRTHAYPNQLLGATELNEIFTNLGTANSGATITITGNPGAATCNQSIATAKGWTVIN